MNSQLKMESVTMAPAPPVSPNSREKGLTVINAPALWAMGYTGYGQLAFTNDTGVDPNVSAISKQFRGFYTSPEAAFFNYDPGTQSQQQNVEPFDCGFHGTHVNGTILGLERMTNDTIGVAFNAQWIGASILCGLDTEDNVAAFQWSLDPDGDPATSDDIPDIINNSWYDPSLDTLDCYSVYIPVVQAMEAAGIAVVFSAGNAGPAPETITQPHNININYVNSFTVGAVNGNSASLPIASFSSRGPSHCPVANDSSLVIKPEVSAPGVDVRSCMPDGYGLLSGTSMASPHVSGAILLLKEAFPYLPGKEFKLALYYTAIDLGVPGEDNTFGMGIINVLDAYNYLVAQGNVPVLPHVENDVLIVDLQVPANACEEEISPVLIIENGGSATLTSFDITYEAGGATSTIPWTGSLAQSQRAEIHLPTLGVPAGNHRLRVTLSNTNGVQDQRPLNNVFELKVNVLDRKRLIANVEGTAQPCEGNAALLRAEYDGMGYAEVKWYDAPLNGALLGTGLAFATPALTQADTFYAEATYYILTGLHDKNTAPAALYDEDQGLKFNVEAPIKLKSVKVFAADKGLRQVQLFNQFGEQVEQTILNVTQVGEFEFTLNWNIPAGNGYSIIKSGGKPFYVNTSGIDFPIELPGMLSITGPTDNTTDTYYYFYDWKIETPEICERTMVVVPVGQTGSSPIASFSSSTNNIDFDNNQPVQFTNTSTDNIASFDWNFGDGNGSTEESPEHTFDSPGIYVVSLAVKSLDGCSSFALDTIEVIQNSVSIAGPGLPLEESVTVYPNPANRILNIQFDLHSAKMMEYQLTDITGKTVASGGYLASQNDMMQLDITTVGTGVYFLQVKMDGGSSVWKVVKL
jgi:PKD repeat protein